MVDGGWRVAGGVPIAVIALVSVWWPRQAVRIPRSPKVRTGNLLIVLRFGYEVIGMPDRQNSEPKQRAWVQRPLAYIPAVERY
jgi:hypothetical protein